ncbi:MAG: response regulator [Pseudobdellovibrio sp.]
MIKQKCLIVEDQIDTFYFLEKAVLEAFPHLEVVHASSVKSAEQLIGNKNILNLLSFCLIDLGLPDGSGIDIIRKIKLTGCKVPLVVATIYDDDRFLFQALSVGATGCNAPTDSTLILTNFLESLFFKKLIRG